MEHASSRQERERGYRTFLPSSPKQYPTSSSSSSSSSSHHPRHELNIQLLRPLDCYPFAIIFVSSLFCSVALALLCSLLPYFGSAKLASPAALHLSHPLPSYRHSYQLVAVSISRAALQNLRLTCRLLFNFLFYFISISNSISNPPSPPLRTVHPSRLLRLLSRLIVSQKQGVYPSSRSYCELTLFHTLQLLDITTPLPHLRCVSSCLVSLSRRVALSDVLNHSCSEVRWVT